MASVVGVLDASRDIRSDRHCRKAMPVKEAVAELSKGAGSQFDSGLAEFFIKHVLHKKDYPSSASRESRRGISFTGF